MANGGLPAAKNREFQRKILKMIKNSLKTVENGKNMSKMVKISTRRLVASATEGSRDKMRSSYANTRRTTWIIA